MDGWELNEGDAIASGLVAVRLLGGGAAYEAYLAFDELTYSPVVAKVLRPSRVDDGASRRGLDREVRALHELNHPVLVRALRYELKGSRPHVVLEHVDGPRLSTLIRRFGPLQEQQYLPLAIDIAAALHYLWRMEWVHLDIKPSNVIMGAPARLIDLSVARTCEEAAALRYPVGTDAYMAPEQCEPPATGVAGPASDVWGLGATLFEAVAGYRPFADGDPDSDDVATRFPQLVDEPRALPPRAPAEVAKVVYAALSPRPGDRPEPVEIATALEPVLAAQPRGRLAGFKVRG